MKLIFKALHLLAIGSSMFSCTEEGVGFADTLEARLVAYDEMNVEESIFSANEDIRLVLKLVNPSSHDVEAATVFDYCGLYDLDEFLLLYRLTTSDTGIETWQAIGKPYIPPVACPMIAIPLVVRANDEQIVCGGQWSDNPGNAPLGPGRYYTSLTHSLDINGQVLEMRLRLDFEVR